MKSLFVYILAAAALLCASCEKYLSELPSKGENQPVTTIDQLVGLLNNPSIRELDAAGAFMTDDAGLTTDFYDAASTYFSTIDVFYYYTFDNEHIASLSNDPLWMALYSTIYNMNLILENVDNVEGSAEEKAQVRADAHFLRAYSYWRLANQYCLPYCEEYLNEPGLPLRQTTDMEESVERATLEETYRFIEADLAEALKTPVEVNGQPWRASRPAVQAFLSRYYLFKGEYEKAATAAEEALKNAGTVQLKDYNTVVSMTFIPGMLEFPEMALLAENQVATWQEFFFSRTSSNLMLWYVPSESLLACYDQANDLRYQKLFSYNSLLLVPTAPMPLWGYNFFYMVSVQIPSGVTIQEVMLNRAESLLRQAAPDKAGALELLNDLRANRYAASAGEDIIRVDAATDREALEAVLMERRRELPFTHRWFDIRRYAVNEAEWDDVTVTRDFYAISEGAVDKSQVKTYTLPAGSRRYALPINANDISASHGTIEQNKYE